MDGRTWQAVDEYLVERLLGPDDVLDAVLAANRAAGLPAIEVSPLAGRLLALLVRLSGARRVLEIGTLGGYSSICMARALPPGGLLVTLEYDPRHAEVARRNLDRAGVQSLVEVRVGAALSSLPQLDGQGPFDLIFIDADKQNNPAYLEWAVRLARPGSVIVLDNVVRGGAVLDGGGVDAAITGVRDGLAFMGAHPQLEATALQTVGSKGHDGLAIAVVR